MASRVPQESFVWPTDQSGSFRLPLTQAELLASKVKVDIIPPSPKSLDLQSVTDYDCKEDWMDDESVVNAAKEILALRPPSKEINPSQRWSATNLQKK